MPDSFGRGGSEDVLREALVVVLGADFKIEAMVEPGNASPRHRVRRLPLRHRRSRLLSSNPWTRGPGSKLGRASVPPGRTGGTAAETGPDERDEAVSRDDDVLDDASESHRDLLTRHLGAEIIADEDADA